MRVLGLDPSEINTGMVLMRDETVELNTTLSAQKALALLRTIPVPDVAVLERPAQGPGADVKTVCAWQALVWHVGALFPQAKVISISPGVWKPFVQGRHLVLPDGLQTKHEKDAYSIAWYWRTVYGR